MNFQLKDVLSALGPTASLVFAAWIFLNFLQSRYSSAYDRYRALVSEYRERGDNWPSAQRREQMVDQIWGYKRRCQQMRIATNIGVTAALVIISGLIVGALQLTLLPADALKMVSVLCIVAGLALVMIAASFVLVENTEVKQAMESELMDLPEMAERLRKEGGR